MDTYSESWRPNVLSDGTKIESLPCAVSIRCIDEDSFTLEKGHECLLFYSPEYSSNEAYIPANLHLQIYFSSLAFNELWQTVSEDHPVIFHGEIAYADLTETSHDPIRGRTTFEWNINDRMKIVPSLSFRGANPSEVRKSMPTELTEEYTKEYKKYSQMRRLSLDIARQIEGEAERRGVEMKHANFDDSPDVMSHVQFFYQNRKNDKQELWVHQDDVDNFTEDRFDEEGATDLLICLLQCPWLRCDELELAVVDYLVFWETFGFREQLKAATNSFRWPSKKARTAYSRLTEIAVRMKWAYFTMRPSGVFSPHQIREALLRAECAGTAWKPVVFAILDRAAKRDPPVWIVPK
jgi:hypothetical protein